MLQLQVLLTATPCLLVLFSAIVASDSANLLDPADAAALLAFKYKADLHNKLPFSQNKSFHFCQWQGVKCYENKVQRLVIQSWDLGGIWAPETLSRLVQLRVLSLQNNSLTGPIPDLSKLVNLKSLFLDHNFFTGSFPPSIFSLHRLLTLDFSFNNLTGTIPTWLISLDRLYYLRLESNRFSGSIPPLNQSSLQIFNVSFNNLSGAIPLTPTLRHFKLSSFQSNPSLCGEIIHKECHPRPPFFVPSSAAAAAPPPAVTVAQSQELHGVDLKKPSSKSKHKRTAVIIGSSCGVFVLVGSFLCFIITVKNQKKKKESMAVIASDEAAITSGGEAAAVMQIDQQESELQEKVKRVQGMQVSKGGSLLFCAGEAQLYTLDQLMRASAEMLGRGTIGTTYKAVLDNRLIVSVKRLDASKMTGTSKDDFERHMESVGGLRHPNLVPLRAYFQARDVRLLIYDYQPNGSLFSLIRGSKSNRARPLHWTSCLKIAEDVAQGLCYIHQAWRLVHGNLKSSNVLLGPDFEACVTDYCLTVLTNSPTEDDPDTNACKAPEIRESNHQATSKSDVYAYGILLLELLTGKSPSQVLVLVPDEMVDWVRSIREVDDEEEERLEMLVEVAMACSFSSPEQRPTMWQVLKMLQEIKESLLTEEHSSELELPSEVS